MLVSVSMSGSVSVSASMKKETNYQNKEFSQTRYFPKNYTLPSSFLLSLDHHRENYLRKLNHEKAWSFASGSRLGPLASEAGAAAKQQSKAVLHCRAPPADLKSRAAERSKAEQFFSAAAGARHQQPRQHALITFCSCPPSYHQVFKVHMMISEQLLFLGAEKIIIFLNCQVVQKFDNPY